MSKADPWPRIDGERLVELTNALTPFARLKPPTRSGPSYDKLREMIAEARRVLGMVE